MKRTLQDAAVGVVLLVLFGGAYYATGKLGSALLRMVGVGVTPAEEPFVPALGAIACFGVMALCNAVSEQAKRWRQ